MTIKTGDRVHCDKWLAHRDEGWLVYGPPCGDFVELMNDQVAPVLRFVVPTADCTLVPRPFKVGEWVRCPHGRGVIVAMDGVEVWIKRSLTGRNLTYLVKSITHIEPEVTQ